MTRAGYVPLAIEHSPFIFATHLPGVTAPVEGFSIGELRISKLSWQECRLIEKSRFMDDLQDVFVYGREPMFVVFGGYPGEDKEEIARIRGNAAEAVGRLVRALRLLKDGEVWDPFEFITYSRHGSLNQRDPGLFGRLAFQLPPDTQVALTLCEIDLLDGLYDALRMFDQFRYDLEIDRAETLLAGSFSPAHSSYVQRLLPLLGCIEMLGGRDLSPLAEAGWADTDLVDWVNQSRSLRNALAHGRGAEPDALRDMLVHTRFVARLLLREAIAWRLIEPAAETVTGRGLVERARNLETAGPKRLAELSAPYPKLFSSQD